MKEQKIMIIFCPPVSEFPLYPPPELSKCEIVNCPRCNQKMWFSEKKKALKENFEDSSDKVEIFFGCYDCFEKFAQENFTKDDSFVKVNI